MKEEITTSYDPGHGNTITLHDGSVIHLHKTGLNYDPSDKDNALKHINQHKKKRRNSNRAVVYQSIGCRFT
jgi:2-oxoglutarate ferredoxin oxidoreductase subunit beta